MSLFDLESFFAKPSIIQIDGCRKDDLAKMASHLSISHPKQILKRELKALVVGKLVELKLLVLPEQLEPAVLEDDIRPDKPGSVESQVHEPAGAQAVLSLEGEIGDRMKTPFTLPRYDPLSTASAGSSRDEARLKVRLARLQMEAHEKAQNRQAQLQYQLEIRKLEIEADKAVRLRQLELESQKETQVLQAPTDTGLGASSSPAESHRAFDVSKHVALMPIFRESEVDSYFGAFERIAAALRWPPDIWPLLLQCKIHGKAQEAVASLPVEDSLSYDSVKAAILRAYELVPEAYRQKFRNHRKTPNQTHMEFAREKGILFDKWSNSCKVTDFSSLRELILLEEFKKCLPDRVVVYLNEQKVDRLSSAAVLADEYALTHKTVFLVLLRLYRPPSLNQIVRRKRRESVSIAIKLDM